MPGVNGHNPQAYLGSWKNWDAVQGNLSGTWRLASDVYVKDGGTWKQVWVRLTAPTGGSTSLSDVTATISWTAGVGQEGFKLYRNGTFVKNVTSGTSTTDSLPTLNDTYTYTVSAYAGATETAQISCGAGVSQGVGTPTSSVSINTDWAYTNNDWNGNQIVFNTSCTEVANATDYQYSLVNIPNEVVGTQAGRSTTFNMNEDEIYSVRWRARRTYNGVTYTGPYSSTNTVNAGRPLKRTARTDDYPVEAWADQERYTVSGIGVFDRLDTTYIANSAIVDSYQFRNLSINFGSQITSSTRSIVMSKPGTNITLSGSPFVSNGYNSSVFTDYVDQRYRIDPQGTGWFNFNNASKLTGTIRFNIRFISQTAIAFTIA
jgi:hypothetical protein